MGEECVGHAPLLLFQISWRSRNVVVRTQLGEMPWKLSTLPIYPPMFPTLTSHRSTLLPVLRIRIQDPGFGAFLPLGTGSGSGMDENPDLGWTSHPGSYCGELSNNFLSGSGIEDFFDPASRLEEIQIRDKHPGSETLFYYPALCLATHNKLRVNIWK